jgi:hypothetical protein
LDIAEGRTNLNNKMVELQKLMQLIKEENDSGKKDSTKKITTFDEITALYEEVEDRLIFENQTLLENKKRSNNELQNIKGNIRVFIRIRPAIDHDCDEDKIQNCLVLGENKKIRLEVPVQYIKSENQPKEFSYDFEHVFDAGQTQEDIFNEMSCCVQSLIDGYNVCILGYGQTGSGKTYTILGKDIDAAENGDGEGAKAKISPAEKKSTDKAPDDGNQMDEEVIQENFVDEKTNNDDQYSKMDVENLAEQDSIRHQGLLLNAIDEIFKQVETLRKSNQVWALS